MKIARRFALLFVVLTLCIGCDQLSKAVAKSMLRQEATQSYAGDTLRLQLSYNQGAFLSLGDSLSAAWRQGIFSVGVGFVLLALLVYALIAKSLRTIDVFALALLLGGGISNLADRLMYQGYVVDFLNVGIGGLRTGIFNVADMAISTGVVLMLYGQLTSKQKA